MSFDRSMSVRAFLLASLIIVLKPIQLAGQSAADQPAQSISSLDSLGLADAQKASLQQSMDAHDYVSAEKILLAAIGSTPNSPLASRQLAFAGSVYFINRDYLNAAVAWKKSEAIAPLAPSLQFSQAMAYIRIGHTDWARTVLDSLAARDKANALYPYWLGRLDYDGHEYNRAIENFQHAIALAPDMARAYDNLGLCYYYQNKNQLAIENFKKAIDLYRASAHPSAWPYLNLAITQQFLNQPKDAETNLREALRIDAQLAPAHFQLGTVLEDTSRYEEALAELRRAATLDITYAEPHMAMARIYHRLGQPAEAQKEVDTYLKLHPHSTPQR